MCVSLAAKPKVPSPKSQAKDSGALPTSLLILAQFAELCDDPLPRTSLGSLGLDECEIGVPLAILAALVPAKKHPCLHLKFGTDLASSKQVGPHYNGIRATDYTWR